MSNNVIKIDMSADMPSSIAVENRKGWVDYGEENNFPDYLYDVYSSSPTHHALCNGIADMAYARGYRTYGNDLELQAEAQSAFLNSSKYESGKDVIRKIFRDLKLYGRAYLHIIYGQLSNRIVEIYHVPFRNVRSGIKDENQCVNEYYYSANWNELNRQANKPKRYPAWAENVSGIYAIDLFGSEDTYYPIPDYMGALNYAALEMKIAEFHLANVENGLFPSFHIHHNNGIPDAQARSDIRREYESRLAGTGNAGSFILTFSEGQERKTELTPIPVNDADKQYQFLSTEAAQKILIGHRVTSPLLFGIRDGGGLGSNTDEMRTAMELFERNVLEGYRQPVIKSLEKIFNVSWELVPNVEAQTQSIDPQTLAAQAALKGNVGGVGGIIELVTQVNAGSIPATSAVVVLTELYGFDEDTARRTVGLETEETEAQSENFKIQIQDKRPIFTDEESEKTIRHLESCAELIEDIEKDYRLIDEEYISDIPISDYEIKKQYAFKFEGVEITKEKFAIIANPSDKSGQDKGFYKIRYQYRPGEGQPDLISTSRNFCITMMRRFKTSVFRKEDIDIMSFTRANPDFGTYSIWKFKGSYNCRHRWKRLVYFLKRVPAGQTLTINGKTYKGGQFLPTNEIENYRILNPSDPNWYAPILPTNDGEARRVN